MASSGGSNATQPIDASQTTDLLKRNSDDIGWEYVVLVNPNDKDKVKYKKVCEKEVREEVDLSQSQAPIDLEEEFEVQGTRKRPHFLGPIDRYASSITPDSSIDGSKRTRQQNINDVICKERKHSVHQYLARWVYEAGIHFNVIDNDSFKRFVEAVGQFDPGYRPPTQYQLREPLLKEEVERTKTSLKKQEEEWARNGCSIMTDAWSDWKRRSIMNLRVNCKNETTFLSSREDSASSHTGAYIFEYVDKCIEDVGPQNVVQVLTDNATNNMAAATLLKKKRKHIFWTSCATHTVNLMLQGIGNLPRFKIVIEKAKSFTIFVYAYHKTLNLMRKHTKKCDIVRAGVTRFATSFLTLQSLMEKKSELRCMVACDEWTNMKHFKSPKGKLTYSTILSAFFWNGVTLCLKVFGSLFKVLRLVDEDRRSSMRFLYGELLKAKEEIKEAYKHVEANYRPIIDIIDDKARGRLDQPLHLAGYFLNPYYYFKNQEIQFDPVVMEGFFHCVETFYLGNEVAQSVVANEQVLVYKAKKCGFGRTLAKMGCDKNDHKYDPVGWWCNYGNSTPYLQRMTRIILSLTTSSSGYEINLSTFEGIINKKRRIQELGVDVLLGEEASKLQGWIVDGGDDEEEK
ncbi:uncharacterized protein LOC126795582 [Argentina anserina]|uniref:uncharacterized protein LOC126795582 n=1 Tax=Argentina anserina TaxID=57926 RepID=UPI0021766120|nr:uncharacterized protein LOC126795582 [Potentilla anserina]